MSYLQEFTDDQRELLISLPYRTGRMVSESDAGGGDESAESEMQVLEGYLPQRLSADEVATEVRRIVAEVGAAGPGDMGKVMAAAKAQLAGKVDMGMVSAAVKAALAK